jgi:AcrR family transcriptional regulator
MPPRPAEQRRLQYREDTRRAILDAAEELLVEGGSDTFSMRGLAERCGCTAPTLYHYFRDKPGLVQALIEERMQQLVAELRRVSPSEEPREQVRRLCLSFARFGLRNPRHYELLASSHGPDAEDLPAGEEARRLLVDPLEAFAGHGGSGATELETLRLGLWSLLHGYILLRTTRPDEAWSEAVLEHALDALLDATLGAAEAGSR